MPLYDYVCESCSEFREWRPMREAGEPAACPTCGNPAPRAVSAPHIATMDTRKRKALGVEERSADQPGVVRRKDVPHMVERDRGGHSPHHHHNHDHAHNPYPWAVGHCH